MKNTHLFDEAGILYQQTRVANWNSIAQKRDRWSGMGKWYHKDRTIQMSAYQVRASAVLIYTSNKTNV